MSELPRFEGRLVAIADIEQPFSRSTPADHVLLFRSPTGWTILVVACHERYDDNETLAAAWARVSTVGFPSVEALEEAVTDRWSARAWVQLLDAVEAFDHWAGPDPDLYRAWVRERIRRDLDQASVHNQDLAEADGYLGSPVPSPGRALAGWQDDALGAAADQLRTVGFEVDPGPPLAHHRDELTSVIGTLWITRYGFRAAAGVRVDDCGEIFTRLLDEADTAVSVLVPS